MCRHYQCGYCVAVLMDNDNASYDATAKGFIARKVFLARNVLPVQCGVLGASLQQKKTKRPGTEPGKFRIMR